MIRLESVQVSVFNQRMGDERLTRPGEESVHNGVYYSSRRVFDSENAENEDNGYPYARNRHVEYADAGDKQGRYYATKHARAI